jgi:hypothetical protein
MWFVTFKLEDDAAFEVSAILGFGCLRQKVTL